VGAAKFESEARKLLGDAFAIKGVDFSIMKPGAGVAMKPDLPF
jgi:hypothetical protein